MDVSGFKLCFSANFCFLRLLKLLTSFVCWQLILGTNRAVTELKDATSPQEERQRSPFYLIHVTKRGARLFPPVIISFLTLFPSCPSRPPPPPNSKDKAPRPGPRTCRDADRSSHPTHGGYRDLLFWSLIRNISHLRTFTNNRGDLVATAASE